jgi:hypothetical protein
MVTASVAPMRAPVSPGSATWVTSCCWETGFAFEATGAVTVFAFALMHGWAAVLTCPVLHVGVAFLDALAERHPQSATKVTSASACRNLITAIVPRHCLVLQPTISKNLGKIPAAGTPAGPANRPHDDDRSAIYGHGRAAFAP